MREILTEEVVDRILTRLPQLTIAVLGDLYLDRYLDLDGSLTEPSLETGLDAYQVVRVRAYPGAAGTVVNNLVALGVGSIPVFAVIGEDGEGFELRQAMKSLSAVSTEGVLCWPGRRTPTYTKPMLQEPGKTPRELNRLDIHNRIPLAEEAQRELMEALVRVWERLDGLAVLDQVSAADCGVLTGRVREQLAELARATPGRPVLADSRERIGAFREVHLKPNERECLRAGSAANVAQAARELARRAGRSVFCTQGEKGLLLVEGKTNQEWEVPAYPVSGPIDPVGAGDSTSAGILCALAAGASQKEAAAFGNLVASITVQQLGTTGTATPVQVRNRLREVLR